MKRHPLLASLFILALMTSPVLWVSTTITNINASPGTGTLFATDAASGNLIVVDTSTGQGTIIGLMGGGSLDPPGFPSLAMSPTTGIMYAGEGRGSGLFYTVDTGTGMATLVGDTGLGFAAVSGLDFSANGTLYAAVNIAGAGGSSGDHLATIDLTTGAATIIGPFGSCTGVTLPSTGGGSCTIEGIGGLAFDAFGNLWGAHNARASAGQAGLYSIDPGTGAATFLYPVTNGAGAELSGGLASIQFDCDGILYGGSARSQGGGGDGGRLILIDPTTGIASFAGALSATATGTSLGALAFGSTCGPPPQEPRSTGFWKHQCSELGFTQVSLAEMDSLFGQVTEDSGLFDQCADIGCDTLLFSGSQKLMRPKAERQSLGLWLNIVSGRLPYGTMIDLGSLTSAMTVGEAVMEIEAILCDSSATKEELEIAKSIAEALNLGGMDMELAAEAVALKVEPGEAGTLKVAIINLSPYTWDYTLSVEGPWTIDLSSTTANNLRSGLMKFFTATFNAPADAEKGERALIKFTATDAISQTTLTREIVVYGIVDGVGGNDDGSKNFDMRSPE
jgi:hypothetical protein